MINVDLTRNVITFEGQSIALAPRCAELASCLANVFPDVALTGDILRGLFGRNEPLRADKVLNAFGTELRRAVAPIGLGVATFKTRGRAFYILRDGVPLGAEPPGQRNKPDRNRIILALREGGMTTHEIADWLDESRNAVSAVLRRAKAIEARA
ncbi:hypothetical protein [Bradyrhizobium elkanii]|uniref:hypothetical protein n=1 Tax=Bradyrhizobium elkanii TaxID=29448 RepID=UPI00272CD301|nr:hypothetical protein [Bradyrhizobium elkanii]WLA80347.1 hypothetical protein QNJ99_33925 [Bradyrhizobium elkanii]